MPVVLLAITVLWAVGVAAGLLVTLVTRAADPHVVVLAGAIGSVGAAALAQVLYGEADIGITPGTLATGTAAGGLFGAIAAALDSWQP